MGSQAGKAGKEKLTYGPMYIHFNGTCLKKYYAESFYAQDEDFDYTQIIVYKETVKYFFTKFGITVLMLYIHFLQLRDTIIFFDLWTVSPLL